MRTLLGVLHGPDGAGTNPHRSTPHGVAQAGQGTARDLLPLLAGIALVAAVLALVVVLALAVLVLAGATLALASRREREDPPPPREWDGFDGSGGCV